jgi:hypothetical protein
MDSDPSFFGGDQRILRLPELLQFTVSTVPDRHFPTDDSV